MLRRPNKPALLSLALWLTLTVVASATAQTPSLVPGEEPIARFPWEENRSSWSTSGAVHLQIDDSTPSNGRVLKITNAANQPLQVEVLTISKPAVTRDFYALRGRVRYENVSGNGYLEMWNDFPGGGHFFSRTLGEIPGNAMSRLSGTSDWRDVLLPFNAAGASGHPEKLTVNVVLPTSGTVCLSAFQLLQYDGFSISSASGKTGWTAPANGPAPALLFNGLVALSAVLAGAMAFFMWRAKHQRNRTLVLAGAWTLTALGTVVLLAGLLGWLAGWPTSLSRMLFLGGLFIAGMFALGALSFQRAYHSGEWRRMAALDA